MRYHSVLFDLDGTLIDNSEGIQNGFRYALEKLGWRDTSVPTTVIGPPLRHTFEKSFGMDAVQTEEAVRLYREFFGPIGLFQCRMYPGVEEMLERLDEAGVKIVLATSKARVFAGRILEHTGMAKHFIAAVGSELDGRLDSKREVIDHILREVLPPDGLPALMVGDRFHDAQGAEACGVDFAAALWGFGKAAEFQPYGNVKGLFEDAGQLCRWLVEDGEK